MTLKLIAIWAVCLATLNLLKILICIILQNWNCVMFVSGKRNTRRTTMKQRRNRVTTDPAQRLSFLHIVFEWTLVLVWAEIFHFIVDKWLFLNALSNKAESKASDTESCISALRPIKGTKMNQDEKIESVKLTKRLLIWELW